MRKNLITKKLKWEHYNYATALIVFSDKPIKNILSKNKLSYMTSINLNLIEFKDKALGIDILLESFIQELMVIM